MYKLSNKEGKKLKKVYDELNELQRLLTDRISENNTAQKVRPDMLVQQASHAFILYRRKTWDAQYAIRDILGNHDIGYNL